MGHAPYFTGGYREQCPRSVIVMPEVAPTITVLIVYYSRYGVVKLLAERIAEGVRRVPGASARLLAVADTPITELRPGESEADMALRRARMVDEFTGVDAIIVGSPSYFGTMASPVKRLFEDCATASPPPQDRTRPWRIHLFRNKVGAAFASSATPHGGNEMTLHSILTMMMHMSMIVVTPGQAEPILENESAPYGPTAVTGATADRLPSAQEQEAALAHGERVAQIAACLALGRMAWGEREDAKWPEQPLSRLPTDQ
jgi:NAD(P)H dehydrogenase (quinone)